MVSVCNDDGLFVFFCITPSFPHVAAGRMYNVTVILIY